MSPVKSHDVNFLRRHYPHQVKGSKFEHFLSARLYELPCFILMIVLYAFFRQPQGKIDSNAATKRSKRFIHFAAAFFRNGQRCNSLFGEQADGFDMVQDTTMMSYANGNMSFILHYQISATSFIPLNSKLSVDWNARIASSQLI